MAGCCLDKLFCLWQGSEYALPVFHMVLKFLPMPMPEVGIWQGCEYARVTKGTE